MKQQINLYQDVLIEKKVPLNAGAMFKTFIGCGLVLLGTYFFLNWQQRKVDGELIRLTREHAAAIVNLQELKRQHPPRQKNILLNQSLKQSQIDLAGRKPLLAYLENFNLDQTTGFSSVIKGLAEYQLKGVWLTDIRLDNVEQKVLLAGSAIQPDLIPAYLQHLGDKKVLKNQTFASLRVTHMKETARQVEFCLESDFRIADE